MERLYREIAREYRLPAEETRTLLEQTLSATLSDSFRKRVVVLFSGDGFSIYQKMSLDGATELERLPARLLSKRVVRLCRYRIANELQKRTSLVELDYLKPLQGTLVRGRIDRVRVDGALAVLFSVDELFNRRELSGICPLSQQPERERGRYRSGDSKFFFVSKVRVVGLVRMSGRERVYKVETRLSRTTRLLPELLLKMKTGITEIRCLRRIAGRICFVVSKERLPREAIMEVSAELGERVKVRWESSVSHRN